MERKQEVNGAEKWECCIWRQRITEMVRRGKFGNKEIFELMERDGKEKNCLNSNEYIII